MMCNAVRSCVVGITNEARIEPAPWICNVGGRAASFGTAAARALTVHGASAPNSRQEPARLAIIKPSRPLGIISKIS
jgi:hypothetical protein